MSAIDTKIENAQKKISKLEQKLIKIRSALSTGKNPYYYDEYDLKRTTKELDQLKEKLETYIQKKNTDESIEIIPVIEQFLEDWKKKAIDWYKEDYKNLLEFRKELRAKKEELQQWRKEILGNEWKYSKEVVAKEIEMGIDSTTIQKRLRIKFNNLTLRLSDYGNNWEKQLEKWIEQEKVNKRKMLIARVKEIVGQITDAKRLFIGSNAEINGIIIGIKGKAKVETISAGGYNIQCFHYRVLVKEIK